LQIFPRAFRRYVRPRVHHRVMEYIPVYTMAKELGVRPNEVMRMGSEVGIRVVRVASKLSPNQAERIRRRAAVEAKQREKAKSAAAAVSPRPSTPTGALLRTAAQPARPSRPDGPDHACSCCGLRVPSNPSWSIGDEPVRCPACAAHFEVAGEDNARLLARLRDHDDRLGRAYRGAWTAATDSEHRMKAALHSRDSWRGALVAVALAHEEAGSGRCKCGAKAFPCFTLKTLEQTNRGIARQVERFGAMSDADRERELYRDDHWDHDAA